MTRKEKELKALEAFDLKIGDRVKDNECNKSIYKIVEDENNIYVIGEETGVQYDAVYFITYYDWTKVGPFLKDEKCKDINCDVCPLNKGYLYCRCYTSYSYDTLGEIYERIKADLDKAKKELDGE